MPTSPPKPPDSPTPQSALALLALSLCSAGGKLHLWGMALFILTFILGLHGAVSPEASCLLLAGFIFAACESYFAWRLAFDRPVFAAWAKLDDGACLAAQHAFDAALGTISQSRSPQSGGRSMPDRVRGLKRLHIRQIVSIAGQMLVFLVLLSCLARATYV